MSDLLSVILCIGILAVSVLSAPSCRSSGKPNSDIAEAAQYLERYGYLDEGSTEGLRGRALECVIVDALKDMQTFLHAGPGKSGGKATDLGVLDDDTLTVMREERCGVKDRINGRSKRYTLYTDYKWSSCRELNVQFGNYTADFSTSLQESSMQYAIDEWNANAAVNLKLSTGVSDPEIPVHNTEYYWNGTALSPSGILAWAYLPTSDSGVWFDDTETWDEFGSGSVKSYKAVALHELGHSLGLLHSSDSNAVMYPSYGASKLTLQSDDIAGIQALHGSGSCP